MAIPSYFRFYHNPVGVQLVLGRIERVPQVTHSIIICRFIPFQVMALGGRDPFRVASSRERHNDYFSEVDLGIRCTIIECEKIEKVWSFSWITKKHLQIIGIA